MKKFTSPTGGAGLDREPTAIGRKRARPFPPYPVEKLGREQAAFDLSDAAQAAARAAILFEGCEADESRQLARLAQRLYDRADAHRRNADQAQHAVMLLDRSRAAAPVGIPFIASATPDPSSDVASSGLDAGEDVGAGSVTRLSAGPRWHTRQA